MNNLDIFLYKLTKVLRNVQGFGSYIDKCRQKKKKSIYSHMDLHSYFIILVIQHSILTFIQRQDNSHDCLKCLGFYRVNIGTSHQGFPLGVESCPILAVCSLGFC